MRDIKFRAWDKKNKEMKELSLLGLQTKYREDLTVYGVHNSDDNVAQSKKDNVPIMQYTGLKDKNGKEIYEGDVVKVKTNHVSDLAPNRKPTTSIVEVKFERAMFVFGDMTMNYMPLQKAEFEVIGNIYENAELIK